MSLSKPQRSPLAQAWQDYLSSLDTHPVKTKAITAAVLSVVSDVIAQVMMGKSISNLDLTSLRNQALIGLLARGPVIHYWYVFLDKLFRRMGYTSKADQNSNTVVLGKVALDQLTFGPVFNLAYFYLIGMLEGRSMPYIQDKISKEFIPIMLMNYRIWPLINILNFKYVPPEMNVLFGNIVSIFWMAYVIASTK